MQLVYIVGTGSKWANNELRYSLRSVEAHGLNVSGVTIVGYKPNWLQHVGHINMPDPHPRKCDNAWHKVMAYCKTGSEPFVLMNDDFFVRMPTDFATLPMLHDKTIGTLMCLNRGSSSYRQALQRSEEWLLRNGHYDWNFAVHYPMEIDPVKALELGEMLGDAPGVSFRCLYGNRYPGMLQERTDLKLYAPECCAADIDSKLAGAQFFSIGDKFLNETGKHYLQTQYPNPSKYER